MNYETITLVLGNFVFYALLTYVHIYDVFMALIKGNGYKTYIFISLSFAKFIKLFLILIVNFASLCSLYIVSHSTNA